jgi:hypothetical protein
MDDIHFGDFHKSSDCNRFSSERAWIASLCSLQRRVNALGASAAIPGQVSAILNLGTP